MIIKIMLALFLLTFLAAAADLSKFDGTPEINGADGATILESLNKRLSTYQKYSKVVALENAEAIQNEEIVEQHKLIISLEEAEQFVRIIIAEQEEGSTESWQVTSIALQCLNEITFAESEREPVERATNAIYKKRIGWPLEYDSFILRYNVLLLAMSMGIGKDDSIDMELAVQASNDTFWQEQINDLKLLDAPFENPRQELLNSLKTLPVKVLSWAAPERSIELVHQLMARPDNIQDAGLTELLKAVERDAKLALQGRKVQP